jgi:Protein of unknown function (DUF2934)
MATKSPSTKTTKAKQPQEPSHDDIRLRAYELSESTGNGDPVGNWLEAERELVEAAKPKPRRRKAAA